MRRTPVSKTTASRSPKKFPSYEKVFTLDEIRRSLPYVRRVLKDAVEAYDLVQHHRRRLARCPGGMGHARLAEERDAAVAKLNRTIDECHAMGISYIDIPNGRVGFRVEVEDRPASVLWRLGDPLSVSELEPAAL
jgi:hypothetical protein